MDEQDIGDLYLADLLLDAAIHLRMSAYAAEVEKPSVAGLKLDLDRLRLDVEQMIRGAKKGRRGVHRRGQGGARGGSGKGAGRALVKTFGARRSGC